MPERFAFLEGALCLDVARTAFREADVPRWDALKGPGDVLEWGVGGRHWSSLRRGDGAAGGGVPRPRVAGRRWGGGPARSRGGARRVHAPPAGGGVAVVAVGVAGGEALDRARWRVARSASELLTSGDLGPVRRCAGEDCTRLFLDTSRAGRRHWCDMSHCGNLARFRRFRSCHLDVNEPG